MAHLGETVERLAAHALGGRIGSAQLGVGVFQRLQLLEQAVVLCVGDLRRVKDVVAMGVVMQLLAQGLCALLEVGVKGHGLIGWRLDPRLRGDDGLLSFPRRRESRSEVRTETRRVS